MSKRNGASLGYPTVLIVGPPKVGKTACVVSALAESAFWICTERGALAPALDRGINPGGKVPPHVECLDLVHPFEEVQEVLQQVLPHVGTRFAAIVIDTLSSLADREYARVVDRDKVSQGYARAASLVYRRIQEIVWECMEAGGMFIATAHETEPTQIEGRFKPGGPKLPGRLVESVPSLFSIVLRCGVEVAEAGPQRVFRCDPLDRQFITGDRYNVVAAVEPMDLRAVLRKAALKARQVQP